MVPEQNPYACLGLLPGSPAADIKRRYRQLAKQYHPDANSSAGAEDRLRDLNAAYAFLSDPARKSAYDLMFAARSSVYNSVFASRRVPQPVPRVYRRTGPSPRRIAAVTLLLLLSTGIGVFFSAQTTPPALSRLFSQITGKSTTTADRPPPSYTFLPSHGAFDDASSSPNAGTPGASASAPATPAQAALP